MVDMPSTSAKQQRFMALVHAVQTGKTSSKGKGKAVKDAAKTMNKEQTKDFMHMKKTAADPRAPVTPRMTLPGAKPLAVNQPVPGAATTGVPPPNTAPSKVIPSAIQKPTINVPKSAVETNINPLSKIQPNFDKKAYIEGYMGKNAADKMTSYFGKPSNDPIGDKYPQGKNLNTVMQTKEGPALMPDYIPASINTYKNRDKTPGAPQPPSSHPGKPAAPYNPSATISESALKSGNTPPLERAGDSAGAAVTKFSDGISPFIRSVLDRFGKK